MGYIFAIVIGVIVVGLAAVFIMGANRSGEDQRGGPDTGLSYDEPQDEGAVRPMVEDRETKT